MHSNSLNSIFSRPQILLFLWIIMMGGMQSCKKKGINSIDPAYSQFIEAYTSGVISKNASIKIKLANEASTTHGLGEIKEGGYFDISPSVKGKTAWLDARTIEFTPNESLKPDQVYEVRFKLGKATKVPDKYSDFVFNFQTIKPAFSVKDYGLRSTGEKDKMFLAGVIETADIENDADVEKLLTAISGSSNLKIMWQHNNASRMHNFKIENIQRPNSSGGTLKLTWNGKPLNSKNTGEKSLEVPAVGDFKVLNIMGMDEEEQYASVQFSDPIMVGQALEGFLVLSDRPEVAYTINGSEVKVYTEEPLEGSYSLTVNSGIKNTFGKKLEQDFTGNVVFENHMPSVKIQGKGNILPNTGRLVLPFESINLNAVDVSIIKIYENNIPQFLQYNDLGTDDDLRRVAKPIVQKTLRLDDDKNLNLKKRQKFSLDIDKFLKTEPGAIYRVTIGFRPEYSLYDCSKKAKGSNDEDEEGYEGYEMGIDEDDAFWARYNNYYPYGYNWDNRDNPCYKSYYNKDRWASRNIIASNIGLTAKRGAGNTLTIAVSDILSTQPMSGVELRALDYQNQEIGNAKTDKDGFAEIELKRKPFLLVAKNGTEKGYLKLDDGSSLALSRFDVGGEEIKDGIKGFIFGERGVWRPGDSLYINCIIEDKSNKLPEGHPVTFELYNPQGQLYQSIVQANANEGYNVFKTRTEQNSPTGNWLAKIKVGGATFEKRLKIETVMPNRLKVDLNFGENTVLGKNANNTGVLSAQWLFGADANNLKAKVEASLYQKKNAFPEFKDYKFDNPTTSFSTETKTIFDGTLNEAGKANVNAAFQTDVTAPGMLSANMVIKVFEPGGAFSINSMSIPYSPFSSYVGIRVINDDNYWGFMTTGKNHSADIVSVNNQGKALSGTKEVEVQFYKVQWRWWWDNSGESFSNFTQDRYNKLVKTEKVVLNNGKGKWTFNVNNSNWGRYLILVKDLSSGHQTGQVVYLDEPGWRDRGSNDDPTAAAMLSFKADKEKYNVGEEVRISIPSSEGGRGLISIESGSKVLKHFWIETKKDQTEVKFKVEKEMAPNVYVNVSLLQPHAQTINDLPIRMYGVVPILVEDKNTVLQPEITMPETIRPEQPSTVTVSEKSGKAMTYSIAIVDEGLLGLTNFKTPDPYNYFYSREALGVKSWDIYDYVIGAWGAGLDRILTIGGDEDNNGPLSQKKANRFQPVVKYLGPFKLNKGQKAKHNFTLPQYIGSVRVMVVGADHGSYGKAEKAVAVKKPLMILGTAPRVLGIGETVTLPVTVFAMENSVKNVSVTVQTNPFLTIVGGNTQQVSFSKTGEQLVYFNAVVNKEEGIGKISFKATSGAEKADYDVELDVRNPNPRITQVNGQTLNKGQQWDASANAIGSRSTSKVTLEISSIPSMNLEKRLDFLIRYPHGCVEQITSGAFPQLVLNQLTDLSDQKKAMVERNVRGVIANLQNYQTNDGGFSYWPGNTVSDDWGTNYAGHFLLEAIAKGYSVSSQMMQEWKSFQQNKASTWSPSTTNFYGGDLTQAYRLYLLAMAKSPDLGAMNRLKEFKYLSVAAKWRLAGAYQLAGQNKVALALINGLPQTIENTQSSIYTFGSDTRDEAMILEVLTLMGRRNEAFKIVNSLAAKLSTDNWYSTQTTAYSLIAIAAYCGENKSGDKIMANATLNGKSVKINSASYISQTSIDISKGDVKVNVKNQGDNVLYVRIISEGQPISGESLPVVNDPSVLGMTVSYLTKGLVPLDISQLKQGTDFVAKVTISNPAGRGAYDRMALTQVFPAGWEIINTRMQEGERSFQSSPMEYQDVRDDRVYTYFNIPSSTSRVYYIQLNAAYLGKYFLPGVNCQAMYDNTIAANTEGRWVEVVK